MVLTLHLRLKYLLAGVPDACSWTASLILIAFFDLSSINFSSAYRRSDSPILRIPITRQSAISSDFMLLYSQDMARLHKVLFGRLALLLYTVIKPCPLEDHIFCQLKNPVDL